MKILPLSAAALTLLALAACKPEPTVVDSRAPDPLREQVDKAPKKELPPTIAASVTFRCQPGNSLLYVDFFQGDTMAVLKTDKDGTPTVLKAEAAGQPYVGADGSTITGDAKAASIVVKGAAAKACKA